MRTFYPHHLSYCVLFLWSIPFLGITQTASITEGCPPLTVDFTPPTGLSSYFWDFANGATSNQSNPSTIYSQAGEFTVSLREQAGGPIIGTIVIAVYPLPELSIASDPQVGCRPLSVNFTNSSTIDPAITVEEINWVFGDGGAGFGEMPSHIYSNAGDFTVSLSIDAAQEGCSMTENFSDFMEVGGVDGINFLTFPNPPISCDPPLQVTFFNTSDNEEVTYFWDLGNGNTFDGTVPPPELYLNPGEYPVALTATDDLGCTETRIRTIQLFGFENLIPDTVCLGDTLYYQYWESADSVLWTFPPTASDGVKNDTIPFVVFEEGGFQPIGYAAVSPGLASCTFDTTVQIFVDQAIAEIAADPTFTCENDLPITFSAISPTANQFQWLFQGGDVATGPIVNYTYTYVDTLEYSMNGLTPYITTLIAINPSGCRDTLSRLDTIWAPNALFMADQIKGCAPLTVMLYDSSTSFEPIIQWDFDYGDGTNATFTESTDHIHTFTEPGEYPVTLSIINEEGCRDTSYQRIIEVGDTLVYDFTIEPLNLCAGESPQLTIIDPPPEVEWWELLSPPSFTLVAEYNGCFTYRYKPFPLNVSGPDVEMRYQLFCEDPLRVFFEAEVFDITSIVWDFGDGTTSNQLNPVHVFPGPGDYEVAVTVFNDNNDCPPRSDSRLVCIRDINAAFTVPPEVCAGESVTLDAGASEGVVQSSCPNGVGYTWYFENNGRPVQTGDSLLEYIFTERGAEIVTLVTKDINGCRDTTQRALGVFGIDGAYAVSDTFICFPAQLDFTDLSQADTTLADWLWTFGDGAILAGSNATTHLYDGGFAPGDTIFSSLVVSDVLGCDAVIEQNIFIYEPNSSIISNPSPTNFCVGQTVTLIGTEFTEGGSNLTYSWGLGDLGDYSGSSIEVTVTEAGSFPITMDFVEQGSGCSGTVEEVIQVQEYPEASFTSSVDSLDLLCYPAQIEFMNTSQSDHGLAYSWDFGNGQFGVAPNPLASFDKGTYTVQLIARTAFGCADTTTQTYTLVGPEGDFTFGPMAICQGEEVQFGLLDTLDVSSFSWDFGDGTVVDNVNPAIHIYENVTQLGNRPVTLILRGLDDQCTFSITDSLLIHDVNADFALNLNGDSVLCAGVYDLINLSTGADVYNWTLVDGAMSNLTEPTVTVSPGEFSFSLAVANSDLGCTDTTSQTYLFSSLPLFAAVADTLCPGDTTVLSIANESILEYLWSPQAFLLDSATSPTPRAIPLTTTTFNVQLVDSLGCLGEASFTALVIEPIAWMDIDTVLCPGDSIGLTLPDVGPLYTLEWSPGPPPDTIGEESLNLSLLISDVLGCFAQGEYAYEITSLSDRLAIPNIFSPNGDGTNDVFRVFSAIDFELTDFIDIEAFRVYNRWGQKVYDQAGPQAQWDGTVNGKNAPAEVYIYYILVNVKKAGTRYELKGEITLVR